MTVKLKRIRELVLIKHKLFKRSCNCIFASRLGESFERGGLFATDKMHYKDEGCCTDLLRINWRMFL